MAHAKASIGPTNSRVGIAAGLHQKVLRRQVKSGGQVLLPDPETFYLAR